MAVYGIGENKALIDISDELSGSDVDTASGDRITFEAVGSHLPVEIAGNSVQVKTTGKQLFNAEEFQTGFGAAAKKLWDVVKVIVENAAQVTPKVICSYVPANNFNGKTVTFAIKKWKKSGNATPMAALEWRNEKKQYVSTAVQLTYPNLTVTTKLSKPEGAVYLDIALCHEVSKTSAKGEWTEFVGITLNEGGAPIEWEPYTGGQPAPNPEYPQPVYGIGHNSPLEINCVTDGGTNTLSINLKKPLHGIGGVADTIEKNEAGKWGVMRRFETVVLDGSEKWGNGTKNIKVCSDMPKPKGAADRVSLAHLLTNGFPSITQGQCVDDMMVGANINPAGALIVNHPDYLGDVQSWTNYLAQKPLIAVYELKTPVFEEFPEEIQKRFQHFCDGDGDNVVSASDLSTLADDFRAAGAVKDEIVEIDGKKYVRHKVERIVFTGKDAEGWKTAKQVDSTTYRVFTEKIAQEVKSPSQPTSSGNISSNSYSSIPSDDLVSKNKKGISIGTQGHIVVYDPAFNTLDISLWKAHLAENPLIVDYELLTPYDKLAVFNYPELKIQYAKTEQGALLLDLSAGIGSGSGDGVIADPKGNVVVGTAQEFGESGANNTIVGANAHVGANTDYSVMIGAGAGQYNNGRQNIAIGGNAMRGTEENVAKATGERNVAIGALSLSKNTSGAQNTAVGDCALQNNTEGKYNAAVGNLALNKVTTGQQNTAIGSSAGKAITSGGWNVAMGSNALSGQTTANNCVAIGAFSATKNNGTELIAIGYGAAKNHQNGSYNIAIGRDSLTSCTDGSNNFALGRNSLKSNQTGDTNIAIGNYSMENGVSSVESPMSNNICIGTSSGRNLIGNDSVAIGDSALSGTEDKPISGAHNVAIGAGALKNMEGAYNNCVGLGAYSEVTGGDQIQLGRSGTTPHAYAALQIRSDARDKADVRDTELGLEFINALHPVQFRWDLREDYGWGEKDGSKKRVRMHNGLIAQEVKEAMDRLGVDFAGYQDHKLNGGKDVLSIGYEELIAPLIKAVQELTERVQVLENELQSK